MGILDGYHLDPESETGTAPPGWLGPVLGAPATTARPLATPLPTPLAPGIGLALGPAGAKAAPPRLSYLAPGVKRIDGRLTGEKFLQQFAPDVQAAVRSAIAGRPLPDANQRPGFAQAIAAIARKYGRTVEPPQDRAESTASAPANPTE